LAADAAAAYRAADYTRAVELLERAYQVRQVAALLYNLAKAYDKLGEQQKAVDLYRRYSDSSDAEPKLRAKAEARVAAYEESHRRPEPRPREPEPRPREPDVALKQVDMTPPPETAEQRAVREWKDRRSRDRAIGISVASIGVAAAIAGMGLSISAYEIHKTYADTLDTEAVKRDQRDHAHTQAIVGDVLYGVAAVGVAVGAYFIWRGFHPEQPPKGQAWLLPTVAPGSQGSVTAGLTLGGRF
jgi:tetratricopeptide (TPR) repeat protein